MLDDNTKCLEASQKIIWINHSDTTINNLPFYMYFNSFKNSESTFMRSAEGNIFGNDFSKRTKEEWGWIEITKISIDGIDYSNKGHYVQYDDQNEFDESVFEIPLEENIDPGDTIYIDLNFEAKIPLIFARAGYQRESFYNIVHWFPQLGVWEKSSEGSWQWNCHQFFRRTEFFAEFGNYDVEITLDDKLVVGASGCKISEKKNQDGTKTLLFHGEDIIDFAWCAYPHFKVYEDQWEHVHIRILIPPEHEHLHPRIIKALKHGLAYMTENVGPYPYNTITVMDPPLLGLNAGFMEYPTFITIGSFAIFPKGIRTLESLVLHEFAHQYFMGIVATNEKEEPWMDEGFVTYYEDKIMEDMCQCKSSLINLLGYKVNNSSFTRQEYTSLTNPSTGSIARPGWEHKEAFKGIIYAKTATMLKTLEGLLGSQNMKNLIQGYYKKYKFKHPEGADFKNLTKAFVNSNNLSEDINVDRFFSQLLEGTEVCDYSVGSITYFRNHKNIGWFGQYKNKIFKKATPNELITSKVVLHRKGGVVLPVNIRFVYQDGTEIIERWSGEENYIEYFFENTKKITCVEIDPDQKIYIDLDFTNNSMTSYHNTTPILKAASKGVYWFSQALQSMFFTL